MTQPTPRTLVSAATLFVAYVATTWIGLALPIANGVVTPVWGPAGIALVGLLFAGLRMWPVVFAAVVVGNVVAGSAIPLAAGVAVGNTAQAVFCAMLLHRFGFSTTLGHVRDAAVLVPAAAISCVVGASGGVALLWLHGFVPAAGFLERWMLWWSGDVMGILVVAPLLCALVHLRRARPPISVARLLEFVLVHSALAVVSVAVFSAQERFPALMIPFWVWSTLRFRAVGSTTATFLVAMLGIGLVVNGTFVYEGLSSTETVQLVQALIAVVGLSALMIAASLTESEHLRAQLQESLHNEQRIANDLRALDETKDQLLAVVSHELRTPLTSILALSVLLRQRHAAVGADKLEEMLDRLVTDSRRLDSLLADLLDLERLRLGMLEPRYERVDIPGLVRASLERVSTSDRPTRLELESVEIDADAAKLERIVDNLLGNAFKHTPADGCVTVSVRNVDDGALISVDDRGDGVPDAQKQAVFEPFNRGMSREGTVPGTGIGLSLVDQFTKLHGGRAWVEDRDGGGSSFRVFLPRERTA